MVAKRTHLSTYVDELVYGANDGIITTFAVVAGASGASLGHQTIIILGLANLLADGFSMGASSFLSIRTEMDVAEAQGARINPDQKRYVARSLATFAGFVIAGFLPLVPFLFPIAVGREFAVSLVSAGLAFFIVGGARSFMTKRTFLRSGLEMVLVGGTAAAVAYVVGLLVSGIIL